MTKLLLSITSSVIFSVLLVAQSDSTQSTRRLLTTQEAKDFAVLALPKGTVDLPGFSLEASPSNTTCISFDGLWNNPKGSAHIDFWLVNRRTGDVWRGVDPVCRRVVSAELSSAQKQIREQLGVSAAEENAERNRVCCADVLR
jgi:hypothetical protein